LTRTWFINTMFSMAYLIDGHNLIPKIRGLSLESADDEMQLVELLQEFCRRRRKSVEVFFDNAPPGQHRARVFGRVKARFVRQGQTADQAIYQRLEQLGRSARNFTVVSSDRQVKAAARAWGAKSISAEAFARMLQAALQVSATEDEQRAETALQPEEVEDWLTVFGSGESEGDE